MSGSYSGTKMAQHEAMKQHLRIEKLTEQLAAKPVRTCYTLHHCEACCRPINIGEQYRGDRTDGRMHEDCYQARKP